MNIYIAASSQEMPRAAFWIARINDMARGLIAPEHMAITHDWPAVIRARGDANPVDAPFHERARYAAEDLRGVRECDFFWLLLPQVSAHSVGCYWEAGYADALGKEMIISGPGAERSIFTTRGACYHNDETAFDFIVDCMYNDAMQEGYSE